MPNFFKRLIFQVYVLFHRKGAMPAQPAAPPIFIWKHSWLFFWHRFFWSLGRGLSSYVTEVPPLLGEELSPKALRHYERFNELASRDYAALSFQEKIIRPTRYILAHDTATELCLFYTCIADVAPWQYGIPARERACRTLRNIFLITLFLFIVLCNVYVATVPFLAWSGFILFNGLMLSGVGWYADACLLKMAREGARLRAEEKQKHSL